MMQSPLNWAKVLSAIQICAASRDWLGGNSMRWNLAAIVVGLFVLASPLHAQSFRPAKPDALGNGVTLECVPSDSSDDADPVYKITVTLTLDEHENATDLTVVHVTASGARYNRAEQYFNSNLTKTPGVREYRWVGAWVKNPAITMIGILNQTTNGRWFYREQQFKNGDRREGMTSACNAQ